MNVLNNVFAVVLGVFVGSIWAKADTTVQNRRLRKQR